MSTSDREYELVLLGASGYTGKYCAEHLVQHLPSDLRWAVAGRNESKLAAVVEDIRPLNVDRIAPGIEVVSLNSEELTSLARKTKLLISTVGPFHLYGTPVVEACARNGTHYVDSTGEVPWVLEMIKKYHDIAKTNGAIIIPQAGIESAPSDIMTYEVISLIRSELKVGVKDVIGTNHELTSLPSGGTLATVFGIFQHYGIGTIVECNKPFALAPVPGRQQDPTPILTRLSGVRYVPGLGTLTTGLFAGSNASIVERTWGLLEHGDYYGQNFQYREYATARNSITGFLTHLALAFGVVTLMIPPFIWLAQKLVHLPGQGPTRESTAKDRSEFRAIATADNAESRQALVVCSFEGSAYEYTGVLMVEAAISIIRDTSPAHHMGGGILTPATLGHAYIDRLRRAKVVLEAHML
ncbi:hypothetical protein MMC13_006826 [Lambiella insularis]|nr:hypothetical protein [Lambiella insularis]